MIINFQKMQGCGNDFLFVDGYDSQIPDFVPSEIRFLCNRNFGIGADGLVVIKQSNSDEADVRWIYYNSDGSEAEMCGNAARCAILFLSERRFPEGGVIAIETEAGIIRGQVLDDGLVEITMLSEPDPNLEYHSKVLDLGNQMLEVYCVNTGVPHAVIQVKDISAYPIEKVGLQVMKHPAFQPEETNVTFFERGVGNQIISSTFERGVEGQTFACGTGAVAAAVVYAELFMQDLPVQVTVPGGELTVEMSPASKMLLLTGKAELVIEFSLEEIPRNFEAPSLYGSSGGDLRELDHNKGLT